METGNNKATGLITFVHAPRGQAPQWVKDAWVGTTVPCLPLTDQPPEGSLRGVDDGEPVPSYTCALVPQKEAIDELEKNNPEAAEWWRDNGFGRANAPYFAFNVESFEVVSGVKPAGMIVFDDMETGRFEPVNSGR